MQTPAQNVTDAIDVDGALVVAALRQVFCDQPDSPDTEHQLLDLVFPKLLSHDGHLVLHGGLALTPAGAVGVVAPSGHGKSTLTASLQAAGCSLISDDAVILRPNGAGYQAERLYPSLRLFSDSLDQLFPIPPETSPVAAYTTKQRVPFDEGPARAPLRALFRLTDPGEEIRITRLAPAAACMAIIENAFALDPEDVQQARRRFAQAAKAAQVIPVFDLTYPRDYARLPEVHEAILAALDTLREEA